MEKEIWKVGSRNMIKFRIILLVITISWMVSLMWWHIWTIFVREASTRKYWQPENFNLLRNYFHKVKQKSNRRQKACSDAGGTSIGHFCNLIAADFTILQKKQVIILLNHNNFRIVNNIFILQIYNKLNYYNSVSFTNWIYRWWAT